MCKTPFLNHNVTEWYICIQHSKDASPCTFTAATQIRSASHSSTSVCETERTRLATAVREIGFRSIFALVHQRVRDRTDEAHVDSEAEAKVLVFCVVSIECRRFAEASQILEPLCVPMFHHWGALRVSEDLWFFTEPAPQP